MAEYFVTVQIDAQRTQDIRIDAPCAYDARAKYKAAGGKYKIIAIRPCIKDTPEQDQ